MSPRCPPCSRGRWVFPGPYDAGSCFGSARRSSGSRLWASNARVAAVVGLPSGSRADWMASARTSTASAAARLPERAAHVPAGSGSRPIPRAPCRTGARRIRTARSAPSIASSASPCARRTSARQIRPHAVHSCSDPRQRSQRSRVRRASDFCLVPAVEQAQSFGQVPHRQADIRIIGRESLLLDGKSPAQQRLGRGRIALLGEHFAQ